MVQYKSYYLYDNDEFDSKIVIMYSTQSEFNIL